MADPRKQNAPKVFDIHRNLPARKAGVAARNRRPLSQPPSEPEPIKPPKPKRSIKKLLLLLFSFLVLVAIGLLIFIGVWDERNIAKASQELFGSSSVLALAKGGSLKTDSNGRVNVLLVGYSVDDPGHQGAQLTDSILMLSMNPANHTGYLLSIPRDLWVDLGSSNCQSGGDYCKINEAYEDGGMPLLEQIINTDFGISTDYYAIIDYTAVKEIVNALGGITVDIQSPDPRGLYDPNISKADGGPLLLKNGIQTLDGQQALNLTRARGDSPDSYGFPQSDFDRTQHQRQVFTAIKAKLNWKLILNPRKNSQILDAIGANIKTDMPIAAARPLFGLFNAIPSSKLQSISLNSANGQNLLQSYITYGGEDALIPAGGLNDYSQIDSYISQLNQ